MTKDFIQLVAELREVQRRCENLPTRSLLATRKTYEQRVDQWIRDHLADQAQLDIWTRSAKSSELPGLYNTVNNVETE